MNNEKLLDLLMACLVYVDVKNETSNPFVRSFGQRDEKEAYEELLFCLEEARVHLPELKELYAKRLSVIELDEQEA